MCFGGGGGPSIDSMLNQVNLGAELDRGWQTQAIPGALAQEQNIATTGTGISPELSAEQTAEGFAPARGAMERRLAEAGIAPNDPRAIAAKAGVDESQGKAQGQNLLQNLIQNFMARSGATSNLLSFGAGIDPLQNLATILQTQLQR